jgi:Protein of unknown function (DUF4058)
MPLLDHFHPPLHPVHHWEAFHSRWASAIADALNEDLLPPEYFAEPETHARGRVEIDVATFERPQESGHPTGVATALLSAPTWSPPAAALAMPAIFPGSFRVQVFRAQGGATLVGAIELVSPANKDRADQRTAFATKCASYLYEGVSLVMVDVVTSRHANLHNELVGLMQQDRGYHHGNDASLYAVAYRPVRRDEAEQIEIWPATLALGESLPTLPLFLKDDLCVPVDLETSYEETCRRLRLM